MSSPHSAPDHHLSILAAGDLLSDWRHAGHSFVNARAAIEHRGILVCATPREADRLSSYSDLSSNHPRGDQVQPMPVTAPLSQLSDIRRSVHVHNSRPLFWDNYAIMYMANEVRSALRFRGVLSDERFGEYMSVEHMRVELDTLNHDIAELRATVEHQRAEIERLKRAEP